MKYAPILLTAMALMAFSCSAPTNQETESGSSLSLVNSSEMERSEVVSIDLSAVSDEVPSNLTPGMGAIGETPVEAVDNSGDGKADQLLVHATIPANATLNLDLTSWKETPNAVKRTQAEISHAVGGAWEEREYLNGTGFKNVDFISVPPQHTDHSWFLRYEGPGWENEMIGYRFYLDWRNAADIFGKKVDTLVLQAVGQDGFDSYHEEEAWGMDILKAGKSLGIGSIGRLNKENVIEHFDNTDSVTCEITRNGYLSSSIETNYYGWSTSAGMTNLTSKLTINSGDRATIHQMQFEKKTDGIATGIVKHPKGAFFQAEEGNWGYIATYGDQTLFDDKLGMAIFYQKDQLLKVDTTDAFNQLLVFKPAQNIEYQFLGAWEKEPNGITTRAKFIAYLDNKLNALNTPVKVE